MVNVVITGGSRGLGKALAVKFIELGDTVVICSKSETSLNTALADLTKTGSIKGKVCDIANFESVRKFARWAKEELGGEITYWINNAGIANPTKKPLLDLPYQEIENVIQTNLVGTIFATKAALEVMVNQKEGHIFLMEGMGSNGRATPRLLPYGASKASFSQLKKTLLEETKGLRIGIHSLSPGVVLTDLLLENAPNDAKKIFNILAERPEKVAEFLVQKIRKIKGTGRSFRFLTRSKIMWRFLTSWRYKNRFFDENGNPIDDL